MIIYPEMLTDVIVNPSSGRGARLSSVEDFTHLTVFPPSDDEDNADDGDDGDDDDDNGVDAVSWMLPEQPDALLK